MKRLQNPRLRHYTIVEMMTVVAICIIIMSLGVTGWINSNSDAKLKRAVRMVNSQLNLARSKAIADRRNIGVVLTCRTCGIYYFDENGDVVTDQAVPDEAVRTLPGGTIINRYGLNMNATAATVTDNSSSMVFICFNVKGQVLKSTLESYDGRRCFWITTAEAASNSQYIVQPYEPMYEVSVNPFTGRSKTQFYEVNE